MNEAKSVMARQLARAAIDFEQQRTGHPPQSVTVMLARDTLVITMNGALTPAEKAVAGNPVGAARLAEYRRLLFANSCRPLIEEIQRITGVAVREASAEVETSGRVLTLSTGTVVEVFLLAGQVATDTWTETVA